MRPRARWTILGGLAGGAAFGLALFLTFGLLGGARPGQKGLLFDPAFQSHKVIAVWKEIQPLPWLITEPGVILAGVLVLAVGNAFVYRSIAPAWPRSGGSRVWRLALVIWALGPTFFELFGPFNLLHEPLYLTAVELTFWAVAAGAEAVVVVTVLELSVRPRRTATASAEVR
jgi:hypothetical protein